jgi:ABC-type nitrate/sulfonate/bicarbonate transport system permease component
MSRLLKIRVLRGIIPVLVLLGIWQLIGNTHSSSTPSPSTWWTAFKTIEANGSFWPALWITVRLYIEGLLLAIIIGVALGMGLGASRRLNQALSPLLEFLRTTPAAAIVPGAILLFRASTGTDLGVITYGTLWPILLNVTIARSSLSPLRLDVGESLGLSRWDRLRKIVLPSLIPEIVTGIRVAAPVCLIVTILVDFLVSTGGLGYELIQYEESFSASSAFALLAVIGVLGIIISVVVGIFSRMSLRRWPSGAGAAD